MSFTWQMPHKLGYKSSVLPDFKVARFGVALNEKLLDEMESDSDKGLRTIGKVVDKLNILAENHNKLVVACLKELDNKCDARPEQRERIVDLFRSQYVQLEKQLQEDLRKTPEDVWRAWCKAKKQNRNQKILSGVKVVAASFGAITSVASIGGAVFTGGGSLALSIIGLIRSIATLGSEMAKAIASVEDVTKKLEQDLKVLANDYRSSKKRAEIESAVTLTLLALASVSPNISATFKGIRDNDKLWRVKMTRLEIRANDLAGTLNSGFKKTEKLSAIVKKSKGNTKEEAFLKRAEEILNDTLKAIDQLNDRINSASKKYDESVRPHLKALLNQQSWSSKTFESVIEYAVTAVTSVHSATDFGLSIAEKVATVDHAVSELEKLYKMSGLKGA